MKNILFFVLCFMTAKVTYAQNGFFLQPQIGVGYTNAQASIGEGAVYYHQYPPQSYFTYNCQLGFGYHFGKWSLNSGVYFLRSGYKSHYVGGDFILVDTKETIYDYHLLMPIIVARQFDLGDRFFITPGMGVAISYSASAKEITNQNGYVSQQKFTGSDFDNEFVRTSFWGIARASFGYKLNSRLHIIAGPEAQYMLSSMLKYTSVNNYQRNYVYTFNAGIVWNFKTKVAMKG